MAPMWGMSNMQYYKNLASHAARPPETPFDTTKIKKFLDERRASAEQARILANTHFAGGTPGDMQSLWPYQTYKPVTWDKYYDTETPEKQPAISSGVAAGVTIGIFFMVFILTFGCRIYSQYVDRSSGTQQRNTRDSSTPESMMSESLAADLWICGVPSDPPPPYEIAIQMPKHNPKAPPPIAVEV
ncbi:unnamed protein product, partial [Mesorhabditis belari]|uniref:Transmembrane protein n=1 Tax=Mesorhabditis belari TaxID=2138241 RepID=A0AAF3F4E4_9BILA